jgi:hypothetical protein
MDVLFTSVAILLKRPGFFCSDQEAHYKAEDCSFRMSAGGAACLVLFLAMFSWQGSPLSSISFPNVLGRALIDYSGASEFVQEHYRIPNYFGPGPVRREESILNARLGVWLPSENAWRRPSLPTCGFACLEALTDVQDFEDLQQVKSIYVRELQRLIPQALEVDSNQIETILFWYPMIRGEDVITPRDSSNNERPSLAKPAQMVHIDTDVGAYGLKGILNLVYANLLGTVVEKLARDQDSIYQQLAVQNRRFLLVNVWRPLTPVTSRPLAIWATHYDEDNGMFPKMRPSLNSSKWYIFPDMQPAECLIFKQYDSRMDQPCDLWHTSVDLTSGHRTGQNEPRRSFDIKAMVIMKETVPPERNRLAASTLPELTLEESKEFCGKQAAQRNYEGHGDVPLQAVSGFNCTIGVPTKR